MEPVSDSFSRRQKSSYYEEILSREHQKSSAEGCFAKCRAQIHALRDAQEALKVIKASSIEEYRQAELAEKLILKDQDDLGEKVKEARSKNQARVVASLRPQAVEIAKQKARISEQKREIKTRIKDYVYFLVDTQVEINENFRHLEHEHTFERNGN